MGENNFRAAVAAARAKIAANEAAAAAAKRQRTPPRAPTTPTPTTPTHATPTPVIEPIFAPPNAPAPPGTTLPASVIEQTSVPLAFALATSPGDGLGEHNAATDAWDYLREAYGEVGTKVQAAFEEIAAAPIDLELAGGLAEVGAGAAFSVDALPVVLIAFGVFIFGYSFGWVVRKVGELFPNPSIFGWHPLGFIVSGLESLGKFNEQQALSSMDTLKAVFVTPVRMVIGMFQRLGNAVIGGHNNVAHVVNTVVPLTVADGVARAEAYVTRELHNIETQLAGAVDRITALPSEAQAKVLITDAARYGGIGWDVTAVAAGAIVAADEATARLAHNLQVNINSASAKVASDAQAAIDHVNATLTRELAGDSNLLSTLATTVNVTLPAEVAAKVQAVQTADAKNLSQQSAKLQGEIDALNTKVNAAEGRIAADVAAIAAATANISALESAPQPDTAAIEAERQIIRIAQSDILSNTTVVQDLSTTITGISSTLAPIRAAQQLNTAQLSPFEGIGAVALPTALATLSATVSAIKTKVDTCMVDNCDPSSPNNIKNVLKDLFGLLSAAGEIGFIAEAIHNPQGTANALAPFLESVDTGAADTLNALLSL